MVKKYQPSCLVNSRIGTKLFDYESAGDNEIPTSDKSGWGYKSYDNNWKSTDEVRRLKERINSFGANYLLNVGPDWLGRIPAPAIDILSNLNQ